MTTARRGPSLVLALLAIVGGWACSRNGSGVKPLGCIEDWPAPGPDTVDPPLAVTPEILWRIPTTPGWSHIHVAMTADAVAISGSGAPLGRGLDIVHLADRTLVPVDLRSSQFLSSPVVADERRGRFIVSDVARTYSVDLAGSVVWWHAFGTNLSKQEFTGGAMALIDPEGFVYVTGIDGYLYKLDGENGREHWKVMVGLCGESPCGVYNGVGRVVFTSKTDRNDNANDNYSRAHDRRTGAFLGVPVDEARSLKMSAVSVGREVGLVAGKSLDLSQGVTTMVILDPCGRPRWKLDGTNYSTVVAIARSDDLIVHSNLALDSNSPYRMRLDRYSKDGDRLASAEFAGFGSRISIGSDDTLYVLACRTLALPEDDGLELVALGPDLVEKWRSAFPGSRCAGGHSDGTLGPDGVYYLARAIAGAALERELVAVRTTSPAPARSSYPDSFGNYASTRWVVSGQ